MRFTDEDQNLFKHLWINKKYETNSDQKKIPDRR